MYRTTAGEEQFSGGGRWSETRPVQLSPSQDLLQSPGFPSTPGPLSTASTQTSICSTSHQDPSRTRDKGTDLLVASASDALINEMVLNSGWRHAPKSRTSHQDIWKDQITESFNFACVTLNDHTVLSDELRRRIAQSISTIRSKMVRAAESYVRDYLQTDAESSAPKQVPDDYYTSLRMQELVKEITNPSTPDRFFLHKQGSGGIERIFGHPILEKFHLDFWYNSDTSPVMKFRSSYITTPPYMLAFSGVALLCALHRVTTGRCANSGKTLKFSSIPYAQHFDHYYSAIVNTLKEDYNGPLFHKQLKELNEQGMERIQSRAGVVLQPFVIPRAVMATSPASGAGTSSDIPDIPTLSHFGLGFGGGDYYNEFHDFHPF